MSDPEPERENQSEAVKSCAESVMESNPDMDKSTAFAICQDMENNGQLKAPGEGAELGADDPPARRILQADFSGLPAVRKTQEGDDVRYENLVLVGAGEWTDAGGNTEYYTERALKKIADNPEEMVVDTSVNVNHEHRDQLLQVGHIDRDSLAFQNGLLLGDIVLYGDKQAGKDTIADMNRALESDGQHGAGGFSIQIPNGGFTRKFNSERGMYELTEFKLAGGGVVTEGASGPANLDQQLPERAVSLGSSDDAPVRVLGPGDTTKAAMRQDRHMSVTELGELSEYDGESVEILLGADSEEPMALLADGETVSIDIEGASIEEIREALGAGGDGMDLADAEVGAVIDEYLANEGSPEDGVDALLEWVRANTDADMDAIESAAADYLAQSDAEDLSETPVAEFMAFVDGEGDGGEEEMEEEEMEEEMADELSSVKEENRELRAQIDDLASRLEAVEDRPDYGEAPGETDEEERAVPADTLGGLARDGDYIGR